MRMFLGDQVILVNVQAGEEPQAAEIRDQTGDHPPPPMPCISTITNIIPKLLHVLDLKSVYK